MNTTESDAVAESAARFVALQETAKAEEAKEREVKAAMRAAADVNRRTALVRNERVHAVARLSARPEVAAAQRMYCARVAEACRLEGGGLWALTLGGSAQLQEDDRRSWDAVRAASEHINAACYAVAARRSPPGVVICVADGVPQYKEGGGLFGSTKEAFDAVLAPSRNWTFHPQYPIARMTRRPPSAEAEAAERAVAEHHRGAPSNRNRELACLAALTRIGFALFVACAGIAVTFDRAALTADIVLSTLGWGFVVLASHWAANSDFSVPN